MITKSVLQNLLFCVELAQKGGLIESKDMVNIGMSRQSALQVFAEMQDSDTLVLVQKKSHTSHVSEESSPNEAELKAVPKKAK